MSTLTAILSPSTTRSRIRDGPLSRSQPEVARRADGRRLSPARFFRRADRRSRTAPGGGGSGGPSPPPAPRRCAPSLVDDSSRRLLMDLFVFVVAAIIILAGAVGVVVSSNPVHSALCLVATLFGVAVLFVAQDAQFLAAVQVIVYAGAIVVLFLFVIMLLGVDRAEDLDTEPLGGQRPMAAVAGAGILGVALSTMILMHRDFDEVATGTRSAVGTISETSADNVRQLGEVLFTKYLFAFEVTSVLLVIAVVAAVALARRATTAPPV